MLIHENEQQCLIQALIEQQNYAWRSYETREEGERKSKGKMADLTDNIEVFLSLYLALWECMTRQ